MTIDLEAIPEILKTHNYWAPFWVTWDSKRGRFDKGPRAGGFRNNDASSLLSFKNALAHMHGNTVLAYTVSPGKLIDTGLVVIDLDHCFTDGKLNPAAARIVQMFAGTYIESSVSCDGVHIFVYGKTRMRPNEKLVIDGTEIDIEIYSSRRFIVMTGNLIDGGTSVILTMQSQLDALEQMRFGQPPPPTPLTPTRTVIGRPCTAQDLETALSFIDPAPYMQWLKVGFALKRWGEENNHMDESWRLFDEWASRTTADNYDSDENQQMWESWVLDDCDRPITIGSIFHDAQLAGWKRPSIRARNALPPSDEKADDTTSSQAGDEAEILSKKAVILPSSKTPIIESAKMIFERLADTRRYFWRGGSVHDVSEGCLAPVRPDAFRSRIEHLGPTIAFVKVKDEFVFALRRPSKADCEALLVTLEAQATQPTAPGAADRESVFCEEDILSIGADSFDPVQLLKSITCLEYQSCEHVQWEQCGAKQYLDGLRAAAVRMLPGWNVAKQPHPKS